MKTVRYLEGGQYLSTAYDFYESGLFAFPDSGAVGTSMVSASNVFCGHLSINGSMGLYLGQLPDRLWGQIWCTPASTQGLSVTVGGMAPQVVYTMLLDTNGVLSVQGAGQTVWKTPAPTNAAGPYFAQITDNGQLQLNTGTPSNPGEQYWTSGSHQYRIYIDMQIPDVGPFDPVIATYFDVRGGKPGTAVTRQLGDVSKSTTLVFDAMLQQEITPNYLDSMPRAMRFMAGTPDAYTPIDMGTWRSVTLTVTEKGNEWGQLGVAPSA